jgi:hypothetical protein
MNILLQVSITIGLFLTGAIIAVILFDRHERSFVVKLRGGGIIEHKSTGERIRITNVSAPGGGILVRMHGVKDCGKKVHEYAHELLMNYKIVETNK